MCGSPNTSRPRRTPRGSPPRIAPGLLGRHHRAAAAVSSGAGGVQASRRSRRRALALLQRLGDRLGEGGSTGRGRRARHARAARVRGGRRTRSSRVARAGREAVAEARDMARPRASRRVIVDEREPREAGVLVKNDTSLCARLFTASTPLSFREPATLHETNPSSLHADQPLDDPRSTPLLDRSATASAPGSGSATPDRVRVVLAPIVLVRRRARGRRVCVPPRRETVCTSRRRRLRARRRARASASDGGGLPASTCRSARRP